MDILVGIGLALAVGVFARLVGLDRDRAFYPTVMIVIALLYGLFAMISGSMATLAAESPFIVGFVALSVAGFKRSLWLVAGALAAHGAFDVVHGRIVENSGVPAFWPGFCSAYDVVAAAFLGWLLWSGRVQERTR